MIKYQIPDRLLPGFKIIAQLKHAQAEEVARMLQNMTVGESIGDLEGRLEELDFIQVPLLMAHTLFSFGELLWHHEGDAQSLASALGKAYEEINDEEEREQERLEENLLIVLNEGENIKKTFKAFHLFMENDHVYRQSRVLSDVRMIFDDNLDTAPQDFLVIHKLKIEQMTNEGSEEMYIHMSSEDILDLEKQLKRAKEKEAQLRKVYSDLNFIRLKN